MFQGYVGKFFDWMVSLLSRNSVDVWGSLRGLSMPLLNLCVRGFYTHKYRHEYRGGISVKANATRGVCTYVHICMYTIQTYCIFTNSYTNTYVICSHLYITHMYQNMHAPYSYELLQNPLLNPPPKMPPKDLPRM